VKRTGRDIWQAIEADTPTSTSAIATVLDRAARQGWDLSYGPGDIFTVSIGNAARGLLAFDAATGEDAEEVDVESDQLSVFALDGDVAAGQRLLTEVRFKGLDRWLSYPHGAPFASFDVVEHRPSDRAQRTRLDGWVCWHDRLRVAWHCRAPDSHGYAMPRRPPAGPWQDGGGDEGVVRPAAWVSLARVVLAETAVARRSLSSVQRARPSHPGRTTAVLNAPGWAEFGAMGPAHFGREELALRAARWWSKHGTTEAPVSTETLLDGLRGEGVVFAKNPVAEVTTALRETPYLFEPSEGGNWMLWRFDEAHGPGYVDTPENPLHVIKGAASEGWDIALGPTDGALTVVRGPGGADVQPEALDLSSTHLRRMAFTTLRDPLDPRSTADDVELEVVHRCRAGGTATYGDDISELEDTSPASSAPSVGWVSVIGNQILFAGFNSDIEVAWTFKRRLMRVPSALHGPRYWLLVARAIQQGLFLTTYG
jgi:hypothetical protein